MYRAGAGTVETRGAGLDPGGSGSSLILDHGFPWGFFVEKITIQKSYQVLYTPMFLLDDVWFEMLKN